VISLMRVALIDRYFADQPMLSHPDITDRHLLVYAFEDYLKKWFFNLLQTLEVGHTQYCAECLLTIRFYRTIPYHTFEYRVYMSSSSY
jgi:hypothetical protein